MGYTPRNGGIDEILRNLPLEDYWLEYTPFYQTCKLLSTGEESQHQTLCGLEEILTHRVAPKVWGGLSFQKWRLR